MLLQPLYRNKEKHPRGILKNVVSEVCVIGGAVRAGVDCNIIIAKPLESRWRSPANVQQTKNTYQIMCKGKEILKLCYITFF